MIGNFIKAWLTTIFVRRIGSCLMPILLVIVAIVLLIWLA
ncbi:hypothetical protein BH24CHL1_BH24CHL1_10090 [soil metagenome]|jgi:hypothetical protein